MVKLSGHPADTLETAFARVVRVTTVMAVLGAVVLLLTAAAQTA